MRSSDQTSTKLGRQASLLGYAQARGLFREDHTGGTFRAYLGLQTPENRYTAAHGRQEAASTIVSRPTRFLR